MNRVTWVQILDEAVYISHHTNFLCKGINPIILSPAIVNSRIDWLFMLYSHWRNNKDAGRLLYKNMYLSLYWKVLKRVTQGLRVRGSWRPNRNCNILTPLLWPSTLCLSRSPDAQPEAFFTASYQHLLQTSTHQGPKAPSAWCGFPYHNWNLNSTGTWLPSWLCYIIIQRPHDRPLDLWNRIFNHHHAEITVMQFTGHSLPVHQSMSVPWEFFISSHFISQFLPTRFPLITAIRMCHLLPVHHLGMPFLAGSKGQNITFNLGKVTSLEEETLLKKLNSYHFLLEWVG